jgi:hypothetical protein
MIVGLSIFLWGLGTIASMIYADIQSHKRNNKCVSGREFFGTFLFWPFFVIVKVRYILRIPMFFVGSFRDAKQNFR